MAINIIDPNPIVTIWPAKPKDPIYTGVTYTIDTGTVTVVDFGKSVVDPNTGSGLSGVITPPLLTDTTVTFQSGADPCLELVLGGKMIYKVTTTGVTNTLASYYDGVSSNIYALNNITGHTMTGITTVNKNSVLQPGYTIYFKDVYGNLNNGGPVLLPNKTDIISGATIYVNGVSIMNQDYRPFKVINGTYLLTYISGDYINKKFFFSLTGDIVPSTEKPITTILQDNFTQVEPTQWYYEPSPSQNYYNAAIISLDYNQLFGTIKYDIDMIVQDTAGSYTQKGEVYTTTWATISAYPISDIYAIALPSVLGVYDKGITFKFTIKQFVSTNTVARFLLISDTIRIISPYQKTWDENISQYLIEMNTAETIEIYFDGYDYIVTSMNKQPYMRVSSTALSVKDPNMAANNYVETNLTNLI